MKNRRNRYSAITSPFEMLNLLDQIGVTDPRIPMITELMKLQMDETPDNQSLGKNSIQRKKVMPIFNEMVRKNDELRYDNELLVDKLDTVASALGACPFCWGENEACEMCQGKGSPGKYNPEIDAFRKFVLPVVKKIRKRVEKTKISHLNETQQKGLQENSGEFSKKENKLATYKFNNKAFFENAMAIVKKIRKAA
jgi:hypothetical protein